MTNTEMKMINYLQAKMNKFKTLEAKYGFEDREVQQLLDEMIACKEMVEAIIEQPVNLQQDGKVTVGFETEQTEAEETQPQTESEPEEKQEQKPQMGKERYLITTLANGKKFEPVVRMTEKGASDYANKMFAKYGEAITVEEFRFVDKNGESDCIRTNIWQA